MVRTAAADGPWLPGSYDMLGLPADLCETFAKGRSSRGLQALAIPLNGWHGLRSPGLSVPFRATVMLAQPRLDHEFEILGFAG